MTWYSWKRPEVESVRVHGRIHVVSPAIAASVGGRLKGEKGSGACSEFEGKKCSAGWRAQSAAGKTSKRLSVRECVPMPLHASRIADAPPPSLQTLSAHNAHF
jgi:hypothetical protein